MKPRHNSKAVRQQVDQTTRQKAGQVTGQQDNKIYKDKKTEAKNIRNKNTDYQTKKREATNRHKKTPRGRKRQQKQ